MPATTNITQPKKQSNYITKQFQIYNKLNKHETFLPHTLSINFSKLLSKDFNPEIFITYTYDIKSSFNFVYIPQYLSKKYNLQFNITRDHTKLKFFDPENDFEFDYIPNAADNSKYIKSIKNNNIYKISTQQYILKNISRWILLDPSDNSKILGIYKTKQEIPEDKRLDAVEIIAKPKIITRIFKNITNNNILIQITRYFYNTDTLQFINYKSRFEFSRFSLPVYVEVKQ